MKKIGLIVAIEINSVLRRYGKPVAEKEAAGCRIFEYNTGRYSLIVAHCGAGEIAAAAATQYLITAYGVDLILNFGVVGGLTADMAKTKVCIIEKVVHYDFDTSAVDEGVVPGRYIQYPDVYIPMSEETVKQALGVYTDLKPVTCASGDKFVADPKIKAELHEKYGADICEMEAAGIALTCDRNGIPCLLVKIVSDGIVGGAEEYLAAKYETADICFGIVDRIIDGL